MVKTHSFEIDFGIKGYRAGLEKVWDEDEKAAYDNWKLGVRAKANLAGAPDFIEDGIEIEVFVRIYWRKKSKIDGSNVLKAVEDGLYKQDRRLAGGHWRRKQHVGREYAEVTVIVSEATEGA